MVLEIVGYIGSALVVISMLMSSIVKLRVINLIGSIISGTYAVLCGALPLALMNLCLIIINVINLWNLMKKKEEIFDLVQEDTKSALLQHFLEKYKEDILHFFPDYQLDEKNPKTAFLACRDGAPIGVILGDVSGDTVNVLIDYSTPAYRDCSVGRYMYQHLPSKGIHALRFSKAMSQEHVEYLKKMGFTSDGSGWSLTM